VPFALIGRHCDVLPVLSLMPCSGPVCPCLIQAWAFIRVVAKEHSRCRLARVLGLGACSRKALAE